MPTNLTNNPTPFTSRAQGDQNGWDEPLDEFVRAISADMSTVRDVADAAASAAAAAASAATAAAGNTIDPARITNGSLPLEKQAVDIATQAELNAEKVRIDAALAAAGANPTPPRVLTGSGSLLPSDRDNLVEMRNTAAATLTVPLTHAAQAAGVAPLPAGAIIGVDRFGSDVTIAPAAANTSLHRLVTELGLKLKAVGSSAAVRTVRRVPPARPAGFWAVLSASQFDTIDHGTVVSSLAADAASSMTLPALTPTGTQRPSVFRNAANGRTGLAFNGSSNTIPLTGAWLDILRLRANAMILVTLLVPSAGITGNRTIIAFSVNGSTGPRALLKWRDNGIAGPVVGGRRTDSTSEVSAYCSATGLYAPDLQVAGGRFVWSSSDVYALRNGTQVASNLAFQTDGTTPDTPSTTAAIGSSSAGNSEFFQGILLDVAIGPDDPTLLAAHQNWAELYYGEEALVTGTVA